MSIQKLDFQKVTKEHIPYTILCNKVIQNIQNPIAGFIWIYLSSCSHDWNVCKEHLKKKFKLGDDRLKIIFAYLRRCNLIEYRRDVGVDGKFGKVYIHVLNGDNFIMEEKFTKTTGSKNAPVEKKPVDKSSKTTGVKTTRVENHTCGSGALQKKIINKKEKEKDKKKKGASHRISFFQNQKRSAYASVDKQSTSYQPLQGEPHKPRSKEAQKEWLQAMSKVKGKRLVCD